MNIHDLITPCANAIETPKSSIPDDQLMAVFQRVLHNSGFRLKSTFERTSLTDAILSPIHGDAAALPNTPIHIKMIGRHMNGSFRCHIGTGKASRPLRSVELCRQMRMLVVFFRTDRTKWIAPEFIFFPTWILHLFRYTQHGANPGRTDVRFLENANLAKEDHIYRLNHVLNTLFRFNLHDFEQAKLKAAIHLAHYLFDNAGLDHDHLPPPTLTFSLCNQPTIYATLLLLLHAPRPSKQKARCLNCNSKPASRRKLCVACYRYQLKHNEPRPLRLIIANRQGTNLYTSSSLRQHSTNGSSSLMSDSYSMAHARVIAVTDARNTMQKSCANCGVHETHQWYRNLCGSGHWCETCKSYYLRHNKARPAELFLKAAKRKVDVRTLVTKAAGLWSDHPLYSGPLGSPAGSIRSREESEASAGSPLANCATNSHTVSSGCHSPISSVASEDSEPLPLLPPILSTLSHDALKDIHYRHPSNPLHSFF
ncbi:uncharacterized protein BYT42DRAFT_562707 [Radiomyces spectabilis]|uniref:uncharacterized protein n=1 Tax=Radiomyces spectabilis TaxID=64574 RepID=UPI0022207897|nr:uncharacterized protein BYT42DRAFT_562707 [Radiomyces spectabilis]KAI8384498.1 hypothetical protein BYT42DRAFT_562707 [Radiomyces spectabilis]